MTFLDGVDLANDLFYWAWLASTVVYRLAERRGRAMPRVRSVAEDLWWLIPVLIPVDMVLMPIIDPPDGASPRSTAFAVIFGVVVGVMVMRIWWSWRPERLRGKPESPAD